jgi:hypothetical protein
VRPICKSNYFFAAFKWRSVPNAQALTKNIAGIMMIKHAMTLVLVPPMKQELVYMGVFLQLVI